MDTSFYRALSLATSVPGQLYVVLALFPSPSPLQGPGEEATSGGVVHDLCIQHATTVFT